MTLKALYGSSARGDSDQRSDVDILAISDPATEGGYSWEELDQMSRYGSLFLVHLREEAKIISGSSAERARFKELLNDLPSYSRTREDLDSFEKVASDVREALAQGDTPIKFEARVTARLVRHLAILACYLKGRPDFTRYNAVTGASDAWAVAQPSGNESLSFRALYESMYDGEWIGQRQSVMEWLDFSATMVGKLRQSLKTEGVEDD